MKTIIYLFCYKKNYFIKIVSTNECGTFIPCAVYFQLFPYFVSLTTLYSWSYSVSVGYNQFLLPQPVLVNKGSFLHLTQITGYISCNKTTNSTYSDLYYNPSNMLWTKLSTTSNWRLMLTSLTNFTSYQSSFNLIHSYLSFGLYNINFTFASSNQVFILPVNVTNSKYFKKLSLIIEIYKFV